MASAEPRLPPETGPAEALARNLFMLTILGVAVFAGVVFLYVL